MRWLACCRCARAGRFTVYAHPRVLSILKTNSIFNVLNEKNVQRQPIAIDEPFEPTLPDGSPSGIEVLPFAVPGKGAWYLEGKAHPAGESGDGDTLGLRILDKSSGKYFYFLAACADVTDDLRARLDGASAIFFDGTVWRDDELIVAGLGNKTGQGMGHIAMSGERGAIESLDGLDIGQQDVSSYQQLQPGAAARLRRAQSRRASRVANPRRRNGDHAVNIQTSNAKAGDGITAYSVGKNIHARQRRGSGSRCSATSARRAITACIRSMACCMAASSIRDRCRPGR